MCVHIPIDTNANILLCSFSLLLVYIRILDPRNKVKNSKYLFLSVFKQIIGRNKILEFVMLPSFIRVIDFARSTILNKRGTSTNRLHLSVNYARTTLESACISWNHACIIYITPFNTAINAQALRCQFTMQSG